MQFSFFALLILATFLVCLQSQGVFGRDKNTDGDVVTETRTVTHSSSASATATATASSSTTVSYTKTRSSPSTVVVSETNPSSPPVVKEKNVTERVRDAILNAEPEELSRLLRDIDDIPNLALGFTFPESLKNKFLLKTNVRVVDPDVVSLKGMALAAVEYDMSDKLTEIFVGAVYGIDFDNKICPEEPKSMGTISKNRTVIKTSYKRITNSSGTFTIHADPEVKTKYWEGSYNGDDFEFEFEVEAEASIAAEDDLSEIPDCFTEEEMHRIRKRLRKDFSDLELMTQIVEGYPQLEESSTRSLLVIGQPVASTCLCYYCWKKKFCNKNVHWCPPK